jgi:hypothetical protein
MTVSLFAAALLAQTAPPAAATPRWERFGPPQAGITNEVDAAGIARSGDRVSLRVRTVRAAAAEDGMSSAVAGYVIDCRARTAQLEGIDFFGADGTPGRSLAGDEPVRINNDNPMQRALFERACRAPAAAPAPAPGGN